MSRNVGAVTISRFRELVRSRAGSFDWTEARHATRKGFLLACVWVVFLYVCFQITAEFYLGGLIFLSITSLIYMSMGKVNRFWTAVGLTTGVFVTTAFVLPLVRILEWFGAILGRVLDWHVGIGPIFFGWRTIGWITATVGISAFLPYGLAGTRAIWRQYRDKSWAKKEILPRFEQGKSLCNNDPAQTRLERDEIAEYWASLSADEVEYRAVIVALCIRCSETESLAELQQIHRRAQLRVGSKRYQQRHKV